MSKVTEQAAADWDRLVTGVATYTRTDPAQNPLALRKLAALAQTLKQGGNPYRRKGMSLERNATPGGKAAG